MKSAITEDVKRRRQERIKQLFREQPEQAWQQWQTPPTVKQWLNRVVLCLFVYSLVFALFISHHPLAVQAQSFVRQALTESSDFASARAWYQAHLGDWPAFIPAFLRAVPSSSQEQYAKPADGSVISPFTLSGQGIWLSTKANVSVRTVATGIVERVVDTPDTGLTVTVRHANGMKSVYGWLAQSSVKENDWLKAGDKLGTVATDKPSGTGKLYLAIVKGGSYIDPQGVISFD